MEAAPAAEARDRIGQVMGYAEGGLAELEHKYEGGGRVSRLTGLARRLVRDSPPALRPDEPPMIAIHNINQQKLENAAENGGVMVAPSIGISRTGEPLEGFGEISLMVSPQTIDPRSTPVYGRDAYTPRYPSVVDRVLDGREQNLIRLFNKDTAELSYLPNTPQNALSVMSDRPWRGGEDVVGYNWLLGQLTPQFKDMNELRAARDRLVSPSDMRMYEWTSNLNNLRNDWRNILPNNNTYWDFNDNYMRQMAEAAQRGPGGMEYINSNYYNNAIPEDLIARTQAHLEAGRDLPTTYFEAKPRRLVPMSEFAGAVIPSGPRIQSLVDLLRKNGIEDIRWYEDGNSAARANQIQKYENLMFGAAPVAAGAAVASEGEAAPSLDELDQRYSGGGRVGRLLGAVGRAVTRQAPEQAAPTIRGLSDVRPTTDNIQTVIDSNFNAGRLVGDRMMPIDEVYGGAVAGADSQRRVQELADRISAPEGYFSRIIVDQDGNVVEGAHRLDALRLLGASEVPVTQIEDIFARIDTPRLNDAIRASGLRRSDDVNAVGADAVSLLGRYGTPEAVFSEMEFAPGFENYYRAALDEAHRQMTPSTARSLDELDQRYSGGGSVMSDAEYDRRLLARMKRDTGRTTESTNAEQIQALRNAGHDAAQLASDIFLPQSPMDAALMVALGPGGRAARLAGSAALMAMEPGEAMSARRHRNNLSDLDQKYAEGGAVSAQPAIYDPDAVNALANQIEAGYV
jgi:hypothetical protein